MTSRRVILQRLGFTGGPSDGAITMFLISLKGKHFCLEEKEVREKYHNL